MTGKARTGHPAPDWLPSAGTAAHHLLQALDDKPARLRHLRQRCPPSVSADQCNTAMLRLGRAGYAAAQPGTHYHRSYTLTPAGREAQRRLRCTLTRGQARALVLLGLDAQTPEGLIPAWEALTGRRCSRTLIVLNLIDLACQGLAERHPRHAMYTLTQLGAEQQGLARLRLGLNPIGDAP